MKSFFLNDCLKSYYHNRKTTHQRSLLTVKNTPWWSGLACDVVMPMQGRRERSRDGWLKFLSRAKRWYDNAIHQGNEWPWMVEDVAIEVLAILMHGSRSFMVVSGSWCWQEQHNSNSYAFAQSIPTRFHYHLKHWTSAGPKQHVSLSLLMRSSGITSESLRVLPCLRRECNEW